MASRTDRLPILLTDFEREHFEAAAQRSGLTISAWTRQAMREKALRERGQELGLIPGGKRRAK